MKLGRLVILIITGAWLCAPALAQNANEEAARAAENQARAIEVQTREVEVRMREAEREMAALAQELADLALRQPHVQRIQRVIKAGRGPVLGVTIGAENSGPVEGVEILGVTPGGAAQDAGLRAGDVITSINGESMTADSSDKATDLLVDFMSGVEEGDEVDVEYLRNGNTATVTLAPTASATNSFSFNMEDFDVPSVGVHVAPDVRGWGNNIVFIGQGGGFGDMEMVKLTDRLGSYFGTDEGLLVVRAPSNDELALEDGDVILNIDGRTPSSVSHAVRILGSYQSGETLKIEIMRDQRQRTIEIEIPEDLRSGVRPPVAPVAPVAPAASVVWKAEKS